MPTCASCQMAGYIPKRVSRFHHTERHQSSWSEYSQSRQLLEPSKQIPDFKYVFALSGLCICNALLLIHYKGKWSRIEAHAYNPGILLKRQGNQQCKSVIALSAKQVRHSLTDGELRNSLVYTACSIH